MKLMEKIKEYGPSESLRHAVRAIRSRLADAHYRHEYKRYQQEPIDDSLIVLESEGDLTDNAYALYDHMRSAGYLERYHVIWTVDDLDTVLKIKQDEPDYWPNTEFVRKYPSGLLFGGANKECARALATCRWFIYDHNNLMARLAKRDNQMVIYLSHGCGYKAPKGDDNSQTTPCDIFTSTGKLGSEFLANFICQPIGKARTTGYPRNDYLLEDNEGVERKISERFHVDQYRKCILWMPTFRQSVVPILSEEYRRGETGLPVFESVEGLKRFSTFLQEKNMLIILKLHHLQADLPVFNQEFENILVVRDSDLKNIGVQLYQFIRCADALISDYSSVSVDYLVLNRPIIYTLDDYEEYEKSRGFFPQNAQDYMPGYHVMDEDGLIRALTEIDEGLDVHRDDRAAVIGSYYDHIDNNSWQRVLNEANIV